MKLKFNTFFILLIILFQKILTKDGSFIDKRKYPNRKSIKGLQPDGQDPGPIIGNAVHTVAFNFVWLDWQPEFKNIPCSSNEYSYNNYCYKLIPSIIEQVKKYTESEVMVTAIVYGVPKWARRGPCYYIDEPMFCAPADDGFHLYGLFTQFLAFYFNGENGNGRISDFVIYNEVNDIKWFNYGCDNCNCDVDKWTTIYAYNYISAYDHILSEQKNAKVLIPLQHDFFSEQDYRLKDKKCVVSGETFLKYLIPKLSIRVWRLALLSYPIDLLKPEFGPNDYPYVTFGNIGALSGWLHKNYPNNPHAWEIQLTGSGINGSTSSMYAAQKKYLCQAFKNILGTPGVESFIYHRLVDHPDEGNLKCGLWAATNAYKPAWELFALANRNGVGDGYPTCGFELLPYVEMVRGYNGKLHYVTTRNLPNGFKKETSFKIKRESDDEEMSLVYECRVGGAKGEHSFISSDHKCENQFNMGPMGYLYTKKVKDSIPIYRCFISDIGDHFITTDSNCEGKGKKEALMGYGFKM